MLLRDKNNKKSGVLLPLSSLPSKHGIGTLGKQAYDFIDFLRKCGQSYWQMLPLVPIGEGNSPYKSTSCYAGEKLYIDLDLLVKDGLLSEADIGDNQFSTNTDYKAVKDFKIPLIKKATKNFNTNNKDYKKFCESFLKGTELSHKIFGKGKVISREDDIINVIFDNGSVKKLSLRFLYERMLLR